MQFKFVVLSVACIAMFVQPAHSGDISNIVSAATDTVGEIVRIVPNMIAAKGVAVVRAAADMASILATGIGLEVQALGRAASSSKGAVADGLIAIADSLTKAGNTITGQSINPGIVDSRFLFRSPVNQVVEEVKVRSPVMVEEVKVRSPVMVEEVKVRSPVMVEEVKVRSPVMVEEVKVRSPVMFEQVKVRSPVMVEEVNVRSPVMVEEVKVRAPTFAEEFRMRASGVVKEEIIMPQLQEVVEVDSYPLRTVQVRGSPLRTVLEASPRFPFVPSKLSSIIDSVKSTVGLNFSSRSSTVNIETAVNPTVYEYIETPMYQGPLMETFQISKK